MSSPIEIVGQEFLDVAQVPELSSDTKDFNLMEGDATAESIVSNGSTSELATHEEDDEGVDVAPPSEAVEQPDGSFVQDLDDGSSLRWTQRPNGTWRKPERKRAGWVGSLELPRYTVPANRSQKTEESQVSDTTADTTAPSLSEARQEDIQESVADTRSKVSLDAHAQQCEVLPPVTNERHVLHRVWCFWVQQLPWKKNGKTWTDKPHCVHRFNTAEEFWCMFNYSFKPSGLEDVAMSVFQRGMSPNLDDPGFTEGGRWRVRFQNMDHEGIDNLWLSLLLALIGERFSDVGLHGLVGGASVSLRKTTCEACLWLSAAAEDSVLGFGRCFHEVLSESNGLDVPLKDVVFEDFSRLRVTLQLATPRKIESTAGIFQ
jgi:hypothetical protein